jgi:hypothetical protein
VGLFKQMSIEADRIVGKAAVRNTRKGTRGGQGVSVASNSKQIEKLMKQLPQRMHNKVMKKATEAAGEIVRIAAEVEIAIVKRQTPMPGPLGDSAKTGTRDKWGAKPKRDRIGAQLKNMSNKLEVKTVKWKPGYPCLTMVGANYYGNNYGHTHEPLEGKKPANITLWGDPQKKYQLPKREWLGPAGRSTEQMQIQAMIRVLKKAIKTV